MAILDEDYPEKDAQLDEIDQNLDVQKPIHAIQVTMLVQNEQNACINCSPLVKVLKDTSLQKFERKIQ